MDKHLPLPGERLDNLIRDNLKIYQNPRYFCFSIDAVLLAHFASLPEGSKVVDLGTGTGVIPLLLTTRETSIKVIGLEIQPEIAEMATRSVVFNQREECISIINGDLVQISQYLAPEEFDLVTSNPPYQPVGKGLISPNRFKAIAKHEIACTLKNVVQAAAYLLKTGGAFAMVHRPERQQEILALCQKEQLFPARLRRVLSRQGQPEVLILLECIKGIPQEMCSLEPLIIYQDSGEYTEELIAIYYGG